MVDFNMKVKLEPAIARRCFSCINYCNGFFISESRINKIDTCHVLTRKVIYMYMYSCMGVFV